jgi:hypothetical protein
VLYFGSMLTLKSWVRSYSLVSLPIPDSPKQIDTPSPLFADGVKAEILLLLYLRILLQSLCRCGNTNRCRYKLVRPLSLAVTASFATLYGTAIKCRVISWTGRIPKPTVQRIGTSRVT